MVVFSHSNPSEQLIHHCFTSVTTPLPDIHKYSELMYSQSGEHHFLLLTFN